MSRGSSLVGVLVAVALVLVLVIVFALGGGSLGLSPASDKPAARADGKGETVVGRSLYTAKDEVCRSNLGQVRTAITIQTDPVDNTRPEAISDLQLPSEFLKCPVGGEPYEYDPATGKVRCPHPGHEDY